MNSEKQSTNLQMILREVNRVGEGQKNVPKLRFKGYEDAWEQRKLGEITEKFEYGLNAAATDFDGVNQYLRITDIDDETREFNKTSLTSPDTNLDFADNYILKQGDILFARTGASVGKTYQYKESDGRVYYAGFVIRARLLSGFNVGFIFQNTLTKRYENFISITSQRSGQPGVNAQEYASFKLLLPKFEEQEQIADLFTNLDNLITLHQRKYDALKTMKKTLLSKMFPKDGEDVPEIRFKGFTDAWEQRKLGDIADKVTVKNSNLQYIETFTNSAEVGIISQRDYFDHDIANLSNLDGYYIVQKEDFVYNPRISTSAPVGPINRNKLGRVGVMSPLYTVFRTHNVDTTYLEYFFKSQYWHSFMKFHGDSGARSDRFSIKDAIFFKMPIPLPDIDEQQKIGDYLNSVDHLITLHQRKLDELKNIKKTLLQQMFV